MATLGVPVLLALRRVLERARGESPRRADAILVLGRELVDDRPTEVFRRRLEHGARLLGEGLAERIVISGGWTGTASRSEADAGREHLVDLGVDRERIWIEERSRHTLENLHCVREMLRAHGLRTLLLVSDPLHLARVQALADGLGLDLRCAPAQDAPPRRGSFRWWTRALREAALLFWYRVGAAWSRALGSRRMLERIT